MRKIRKMTGTEEEVRDWKAIAAVKLIFEAFP
jgi:hypothetical protein